MADAAARRIKSERLNEVILGLTIDPEPDGRRRKRLNNSKIARIQSGDLIAYAFDVGPLVHGVLYYVDREEMIVHVIVVLTRNFTVPAHPPAR